MIEAKDVKINEIWNVEFEWVKEDRLPDGSKNKTVVDSYKGFALVTHIGEYHPKGTHVCLQWVDKNGFVQSSAQFTTNVLKSREFDKGGWRLTVV